MKFLGDDLILNIAKRVAADSSYALCSFMRTNKCRCSLCRSDEDLMVLNNSFVELLIELDLTYDTLRFMWRLWQAGHPTFCLLRCTQQMLHPRPRLGVIKQLLKKASDVGSNSAKYFNFLIRATSYPCPDYEQLFKDFWELLMTRNLSQYRHDIMGIGTSYRFHCHWYKRRFPLHMVYRNYCNNWHNCPGDGRRGGYRGLLPAEDEEYSYRNFCVCCRLDSEIRWLVDVFGFDHNA
jgi:hypothetical protein